MAEIRRGGGGTSVRVVRRVLAIFGVGLVLGACGGVPDSYRRALHIEAGRSGATYCATRDNGPYEVEILAVVNPGELSIEIRDIEVVDGNVDVEFLVVRDPTGEDESVELQRQELPAVIRPGDRGEVVALMPGTVPADRVDFVYEFEITAAVDGEEERYRYRALRMSGAEPACDELATRLIGA